MGSTRLAKFALFSIFAAAAAQAGVLDCNDPKRAQEPLAPICRCAGNPPDASFHLEDSRTAIENHLRGTPPIPNLPDLEGAALEDFQLVVDGAVQHHRLNFTIPGGSGIQPEFRLSENDSSNDKVDKCEKYVLATRTELRKIALRLAEMQGRQNDPSEILGFKVAGVSDPQAFRVTDQKDLPLARILKMANGQPVVVPKDAPNGSEDERKIWKVVAEQFMRRVRTVVGGAGKRPSSMGRLGGVDQLEVDTGTPGPKGVYIPGIYDGHIPLLGSKRLISIPFNQSWANCETGSFGVANRWNRQYCWFKNPDGSCSDEQVDHSGWKNHRCPTKTPYSNSMHSRGARERGNAVQALMRLADEIAVEWIEKRGQIPRPEAFGPVTGCAMIRIQAEQSRIETQKRLKQIQDRFAEGQAGIGALRCTEHDLEATDRSFVQNSSGGAKLGGNQAAACKLEANLHTAYIRWSIDYAECVWRKVGLTLFEKMIEKTVTFNEGSPEDIETLWAENACTRASTSWLALLFGISTLLRSKRRPTRRSPRQARDRSGVALPAALAAAAACLLVSACSPKPITIRCSNHDNICDRKCADTRAATDALKAEGAEAIAKLQSDNEGGRNDGTIQAIQDRMAYYDRMLEQSSGECKAKSFTGYSGKTRENNEMAEDYCTCNGDLALGSEESGRYESIWTVDSNHRHVDLLDGNGVARLELIGSGGSQTGGGEEPGGSGGSSGGSGSGTAGSGWAGGTSGTGQTFTSGGGSGSSGPSLTSQNLALSTPGSLAPTNTRGIQTPVAPERPASSDDTGSYSVGVSGGGEFGKGSSGDPYGLDGMITSMQVAQPGANGAARAGSGAASTPGATAHGGRNPASTGASSTAMLSEDPDNYFDRIPKHVGLFQIVSDRYTHTAKGWIMRSSTPQDAR